MLIRVALATAIAALIAASPAIADPKAKVAVVAATDDVAIKGVVARQMAAFRRGDANAMFAAATPKVRRVFRTPETFVAAMKKGCGPVYHASRVAFRDLVRIDGMLVQPVHVVAVNEIPVTALYIVERQPGGEWRIDGCVLAREPGRNI